MTRSAMALIIAIIALQVSCGTQPTPRKAALPQGRQLTSGKVTQLSGNHGNAYTDIASDRYEALGLAPGKRIDVAFPNVAMTLVVGRTYTDVPGGTPLAVLHNEGLTFAICDGNFSAAYGIEVGTTFVISMPTDSDD